MIDFECNICGAVTNSSVSEVRMGFDLYCSECDSDDLTEIG